MLVVERKPGDSLTVDGPARITFLGWGGNSGSRARIGVEADRSVKILREELPPRENLKIEPEVEVI